MSSWASGWIFAKGLKIKFEDRFLDVAVKIHGVFGGELGREGDSFFLSLSSYPKNFELNLDFLKGLFEAGGVLGNRAVFIPLTGKEFIDTKVEKLLSPFAPVRTEGGFFLRDDSAVLFLHAIYDESSGESSNYYFEKFLSLIYGGKWERNFIEFSLEDGGIAPFKKRVSDSGWDLHLVELIKEEGKVYFFDTKVKVKPSEGYYLDLVPRSSIYKSGFVLANSVGIIDMTYRGTIKVPLVRVDESKEMPSLPWRAVQLVPRKFYPLEMREVSSLDKTIRGEGGFGSTGR